jgi:nucleotide-binding universal stress UspA family protein
LIRQILVALDGSKHANKALDLALDVAEKHLASVTLLSVLHFPPMAMSAAGIEVLVPTGIEQFWTDLKKDHEEILTLALKKAKNVDPNLNVTKKLVEGRPADTIVEIAKEGKFDIIFMESRGLGAIKEFFLGSVSHQVAHEAPCPVVIVK